jgi:hypothetical protein
MQDVRMEIEVPLSGGRITSGVVKVGDTVRRPAAASSPFIAELLGELRRRGFTGAPRHLGFDWRGREILTYLPGQVPARFQQWTDPQVAAAGSLLRGFHDATRGSRLAGRHPVVCHHDPGPNNTVFADDVPVAFIDFDTAAPGDPLEDLGYMAWTWCISSKPGAAPAAVQAAQVRSLADAYGLDATSRSRLIDAVLDRQTGNAQWWRSHLAGPSPHVADDHKIVERVRWSEREYAYASTHRTTFDAALE